MTGVIEVKFYLVPVGKTFTYKDETYTKSGPITASSELDGKNKMIPRSANVVVLGETVAKQDNPVTAKSVSLDDVKTQLKVFNLEIVELVTSHCCEDEMQKLDLFKSDFEKAYLKLLSQLDNIPIDN